MRFIVVRPTSCGTIHRRRCRAAAAATQLAAAHPADDPLVLQD